MYQRSDVEVLDIRRSIDGIKALLTEHPFSAVPLSRVIGPRKRRFSCRSAPPGTAAVHPDRVAVIHEDRRITYRDFHARARRLASALVARAIRAGDRA